MFQEADQNNKPKFQLRDVSALSIQCAQCGVPINELPFEPNKRQDGTFGKLYCRTCNQQRKNTGF